jgi:Peptidase family M1 domain
MPLRLIARQSMAEFVEVEEWFELTKRGKQEAYHRDSRITTHPIEVPINSTADFFSVFDDITYEKGSSVLKQLAHYVGEENYRLGVSAYLEQYSYGTTGLDDFVGHIAVASDTNLDAWSREWLYEPGFFMSSYASMLLTPMCVEESVAKMQKALDTHAEELSSTALRFLREAHQADSECLALRSKQKQTTGQIQAR